MRRPTNKRVDRRVFRSTANKTRQINITPNFYRGGIRL